MNESANYDEIEDKWMFASIKKYDQLQMYDLENVVCQLKKSSFSDICTIHRNKSKQDQLLEYSLPSKLMVEPENEGLTKDCDLKIKCGAFFKNEIYKMSTLYGEQKVIISEVGKTEVGIHELGSEESDLIKPIGHCTSDLISPDITCNSLGQLLLGSRSNQPLLVADIASLQTMYSLSTHKTTNEDQPIGCHFLNDNTAAACYRNSGKIITYDLRTGEMVGNINPKYTGGNNWQLDSSYTNYSSNSMQNDCTIVLWESTGNVEVFDLRNQLIPKNNLNLKELISSNLQIRVSPFKTTQIAAFSTSGGDILILDIMKTSSPIKPEFIHDGHSILNPEQLEVKITDVLWLRDQTLVSSANTKTLHCWNFNSQTT